MRVVQGDLALPIPQHLRYVMGVCLGACLGVCGCTVVVLVETRVGLSVGL